MLGNNFKSFNLIFFKFSTELSTKKTCPPLATSFKIAPHKTLKSNSLTKQMTGFLSTGGVCTNEIALILLKESSKDLGIGVADKLKKLTVGFSCKINSLSFTPKRCSSSTMKKPQNLNTLG